MLEFQRGLSFLFPICYVYVLFMLSISGLLFAFLHFTTVDFPVPKQRVSGLFLLVCEIFGVSLATFSTSSSLNDHHFRNKTEGIPLKPVTCTLCLL